MKKIGAFVFALLIFISCKKNDNQTTEDTPQEQGLSDQELSYWESLGVDTSITTKDLVFGKDQSVLDWINVHNPEFLKGFKKTTAQPGYDLVENKLTALVTGISYAAGWLANDANFEEFGQKNGIAYVWGSADYSSTSSCTEAIPKVKCECPSYMHGLDCSGYVYLIFKQFLGVDLGKEKLNTTGLAKASVWNEAFEKSEMYKGIVAIEINNPTDLKEGDILVKPGSHMGIIVKEKGGKYKFANSLGGYTKSCATNSDAGHGPILLPVAGNDFVSELNASYIKGFKIIRFTNPNSCYSGNTPVGDKTKFKLSGNPSYDGTMYMKNVQMSFEFDKSLTKLVQIGGNVSIWSDDIKNFHLIESKVPYSTVPSMTNQGGEITIKMNDETLIFHGTINGKSIPGVLSLRSTYIDDATKYVTPIFLTCDLTLNLVE